MLDLPLLDERFLLILGIVLLDFEIHVDLVVLMNFYVCEVELLKIEIVSTKVRLLAFEIDGVVLIVVELVSKLNHVNPSSHDAPLIDRVSVLCSREELSILLSDSGIETIFELTEDARRH